MAMLTICQTPRSGKFRSRDYNNNNNNQFIYQVINYNACSHQKIRCVLPVLDCTITTIIHFEGMYKCMNTLFLYFMMQV